MNMSKMSYEWMNSTPQSVPAIAERWHCEIKSIYGEPPLPLTPKQYGQLKQLRDKLRELTWYVAGEVVRVWPQFTQRVETAKGLLCSPSKPHIGFLLAYYDIAVNLLHEVAQNSDSPCATDFAQMVDKRIFEQHQELAEELYGHNPEVIAVMRLATTTEELRSLLQIMRE